MEERGLLSRLVNSDSVHRSTNVHDSIASHLRALLNTRLGEAVTVPDFGVVDFSDLVHQFPASIQVLQQSIRATLLKYEPRLKSVSVRHTPDEDPLSLEFEITAQLTDKDGRGVLRFQTQMSPGGRVEVW